MDGPKYRCQSAVESRRHVEGWLTATFESIIKPLYKDEVAGIRRLSLNEVHRIGSEEIRFVIFDDVIGLAAWTRVNEDRPTNRLLAHAMLKSFCDREDAWDAYGDTLKQLMVISADLI